MAVNHQVSYVDELLADGSVHRAYSDGRQEWRTRGADGTVHWRDGSGRRGVDEPLGGRLVKRSEAGGGTRYGREAGFGRTLWSDGVLTVNRSKFGGRLGAILAGAAGVAVLGAIALPPQWLSPEDELALRAQGAPNQPGGDVGHGAYGDWGGPGDDGGDFG